MNIGNETTPANKADSDQNSERAFINSKNLRAIITALIFILSIVSAIFFAPDAPQKDPNVSLSKHFFSNYGLYTFMSFLYTLLFPFIGYTVLKLTHGLEEANNMFNKKLPEHIDSAISKSLACRLRESLKFYYDPGEIESFRRDFHFVMHELFKPNAEELMPPILKFIDKSIGDIIH